MYFRNWLLPALPLFILTLMGGAALLDLLVSRSSDAMWAGFAGVSVALISVTAIVFTRKHLSTTYAASAIVASFAGFALVGTVQSSRDPVSIAIIGGGVCLGCLVGLLQATFIRNEKSIESAETVEDATDSSQSDSTAINESFEFIEETPNEEIRQTWNRFLLANGTERLEGCVTLTFDKGEQLRHFHIPISPPFSGVPIGHCESSDDACRATFTQLQPYGARLTLKRRVTHTAAETVELEIALMTSQEQRVAA